MLSLSKALRNYLCMNAFRMNVASLAQISTGFLNKTARTRLSCRVQEVADLKLALNSLASERLALSLIGKIIDDFDQLLNLIGKGLCDYEHYNVLHLRVRRELNIVYDHISNGLDACVVYPPHLDGECDCYNSLFNGILKRVNRIEDKVL